MTFFLHISLPFMIAIFALGAVSFANESKSGEPELSAESQDAKVIYGIDNRKDIYQLKYPYWREKAASTVAIIKNTDLIPDGEFTRIRTENYGAAYNLCEEERFRGQGIAPFCSGFFVGEDLIVTAGHCMKTYLDCSQASVVFDFAVFEAGKSPRRSHNSNVYRCKGIVHSEADGNGKDFAIIQVDRPVANRSPAQMRQTGAAKIGQELVVIGHPMGLPTKVAPEGVVRKVNPDFLTASLDTYGGNSGSAVFNRKTGLVEGILVRGEKDLVYAGSCYRSKVCKMDGCNGEEITRIEHVREVLAKSRF